MEFNEEVKRIVVQANKIKMHSVFDDETIEFLNSLRLSF